MVPASCPLGAAINDQRPPPRCFAPRFGRVSGLLWKQASVESPIRALTRLRRAGGLIETAMAIPSGTTPPPSLNWNRAGAGPRCRASLVSIVGMATRPIPPRLRRSSRPQAHRRRDRGIVFALRFRGATLSRLQPSGRRRTFGAHGRRAFGLLLRPTMRRDLAPASGHHLTLPRVPRNEALRAPTPPTLGNQSASRFQISEGGRICRPFIPLSSTPSTSGRDRALQHLSEVAGKFTTPSRSIEMERPMKRSNAGRLCRRSGSLPRAPNSKLKTQNSKLRRVPHDGALRASRPMTRVPRRKWRNPKFAIRNFEPVRDPARGECSD